MKKFAFLTATFVSIFLNTIAIFNVSGQIPGSPTNLGVTAGSGSVILSWDLVSGATSYNVYLSRYPGINNLNYQTRLGMQIAGVQPSYQLTGLNNGTTYYFVVTSVNSSGESSPSNEVSATPPTTANSPILFEDISTIAGLVRNRWEAYGNPLCGDLNNDGNLDIIDPHHVVAVSVYLNNGNETFTDITESSGISLGNGFDRHGMTIGDYDNDGSVDLFIALGGLSGNSLLNSQLWKGNGTGTFVNVADEAGIQMLAARTANWVDFDNDGYLDLFSNSSQRSLVVYKNNKNGTFSDVTSSIGITTIASTPRVISFADYDNDGYMDLFAGGDTRDSLYHNNGNGTFSLTRLFGGNRCRGATWGDYNNDGFIDLYLSRGENDYYRTLFWDRSRIDFSFSAFPDPGEVTFRCDTASNITFNLQMSGKLPWESFIFLGSTKTNPSTNPFTLSTAQFFGRPVISAGAEDGFFVWRDTDDTWHIQWTESAGNHDFWGHITADGDFSDVTANEANLLVTNYKSSLYRNNGDGTFTDVTEESGTGHVGNNSGVSWGDFDNDGLLDLYVVDAGDILGNRPNALYRNLGNGRFNEIGVSTRVDAASAIGRHYGAACGDFNNDGSLDLILANGYGWGTPLSRGRSLLYKNSGTTNNWIKLKLVGTKSNRSAIGSRVILSTANGIQTRQLNGNGGELYSQGLSPLHFGLGTVNVVDSVTIIWPSGTVQKLNQIPVNQELTVTETSGLLAHYKFDEGIGRVASDSSGNGNNGSISGATWIVGKIGNGLSFDGVNDYVRVPRMNYDEISICAWFLKNGNDTIRGDGIFGGFRNNSNIQLREGFDVRFSSGAPDTLEFVLVTQDGSGNRTQGIANSNLGNSVGSWFHAAGTYNKTTGEQRLYVNGQLVNTQTHPAGNTIVPQTYYPSMRIGYSAVNSGFFNGIIDEVQLYSRSLSSQEVSDLYSN